MKKKILNICCFLLLTLCAYNCTKENKNSKQLVFDKEMASLVEDTKMQICDSIALENRDDVLLTGQSQMQTDGKSYFLCNNNSVFRFDAHGKLENIIGALGHGRGEYERLLDFTLNRDKGTVNILSTHALNSYKYDGTFVERQELSIPANSLSYENGLYFFSTGNNTFYSKKSVSVCDSKLRLQNECIEIGHDINSESFDFGRGEYLTYSFLYSHKAYRFSDGKVACAYNLNFKNLHLPEELYEEKIDLVKASKIMSQNNFAMVNRFLENKKYIYVHVIERLANSKEMMFYHWFINKDNKKNIIIKMDMSYYDTYHANPQYLSKDNKLYLVGNVVRGNNNHNNPSIVVVDVSKML